MTREFDRLRRSVRMQLAIVRTITEELGREGFPSDALCMQANVEAARLLAAMEAYTQARATSPDWAACSSDPRRSLAEGSRPRVLLVDDDTVLCRAIAGGLGQGYDMFTAGDGREALKLARETLPDAIIADVQLPEMDGIVMMNEIRELGTTYASVPVILLTAFCTPEHVTAGFAAGAAGYLVKPVDLELLDDELRWALGPRASHSSFDATL